MQKKKPIQAIVLLAFIVIIPLGSWYYLRMGYDYRKEALNQMKDHGQFPNLSVETVDGKANVADSLAGKMVIAHLLNTKNEKLSAQYGKTLKKLHDQFKNTGRFAIVSLGVNPNTDNKERLSAFAKQYELYDQPHYYIIAADSNGVQPIANQLYFPELDLENANYFALADTSMMVKNHYTVLEEESIRELVTHAAMFMPRNPKRKIIFKRETEK